MAPRRAIVRTLEDGIVLRLRVTPQAAADAVTGLHIGAAGLVALDIRVTQAPDRGKANKAVITLLANRLGFAKSALQIVAGQTARHKQLRINGRPSAIIAELERLTAPAG